MQTDMTFLAPECWEWLDSAGIGLQRIQGLIFMETMCYVCVWPQQCWESCANILVLCFGDHGTNEMPRVVGSKV